VGALRKKSKQKWCGDIFWRSKSCCIQTVAEIGTEPSMGQSINHTYRN